jgi:hypothetical protein
MRDIDIRKALREIMASVHGNEPDTLIVEELGLCQGTARVDLAVVNGSLHGYEIKSERDTLIRLPAQTEVYSRTLDFVTIVGAQSHEDKISSMVPAWWGIWIAAQEADRLRLQEKRAPRKNPSTDPFSVAQFLWREEALQALADYNLAAGMKSKTRDKLWRRLAGLDVTVLSSIVRERLKQRGTDWRVVAQPS